MITSVVLAGVSGLGGVVALSRVRAQTDERRVQTLILLDVERLHVLIEEKVATSRAYLLTGESKYITELREERSELLRVLEDLQGRARTDQSKRLLAEVGVAEARHQERLDVLLRDWEKSAPPVNGEVALAFTTVLKPARDALSQKIEAVAENAQEMSERSATRASTVATWASWLMAIGSILATLVGCVLAFVFGRSLTRSYERERLALLKLTEEEAAREDAMRRATASELEAQMFKLLEAVPVGIFILKGDGSPYYANQHAMKLLGRGLVPSMAPTELAETYKAFVAGSSEHYPIERMPIIRALAGEQATVTDMEIRRGEEVIPIQVTATPLVTDGRVEYAIAAFQDIRALRDAALRDAVTGLPNRSAFLEAFGRLAPFCKRAKEPLTIGLLDMDRFKSINDRFGHPMGDEVLRRSGLIITNALRRADLLCRWGGEEFAVMLPDTDVKGATVALEKSLAQLRQESFVTPAGISFNTTFSAGVVEVIEWTNLDRTMEEADKLLYMAKAAGRNRVCGLV